MAVYRLLLERAGAAAKVVNVTESATVKLSLAESVVIVTETIPAKDGMSAKQHDTLYPMRRILLIERWDVAQRPEVKSDGTFGVKS